MGSIGLYVTTHTYQAQMALPLKVPAMDVEQVSPSHSSDRLREPYCAQTNSSPAARDASFQSRAPPSVPSSKSRRNSLPFAFPPLFSQPVNSSSTSLIPAEGRPIPLDNGVAAHGISTLRELNERNPSPVNRHRYTKSTGAQSSTYSQPVIVRTYSGPSPSNTHSYPYRPSSVSRGGGSRRIPLPPSSRSSVKHSISQAGGASLSNPSSSTGSVNGGRVIVNNMPRPPKAKKSSKLPWQWPLISRRDDEDPKLPPLEAFSFKSFMADLQEEGSGINSDLDRIAEICARSRYSLSNQYEVHVAPHGSGASFATSAGVRNSRRRNLGAGSSNGGGGGPTLQACASDDDERSNNSHKGHRKRRSAGGGRRKSVAYGTLETIMSSSRSSEEDKGKKKKSAAEIADEVRGRAVRKSSDSASAAATTPSGGSGTRSENVSGDAAGTRPGIHRRKSSSLANALIENRRHGNSAGGDAHVASPRSSASALVSQPAQPQTSPSHLEIRTAPEGAEGSGPDASAQSAQNAELMDELADMVSRTDEVNAQNGGGLLAGWNAWMPWIGGGSAGGTYATGSSSQGQPEAAKRGVDTASSHAEGRLRQLLLTVESKDKDKDRDEDQDKGKTVVIRHG